MKPASLPGRITSMLENGYRRRTVVLCLLAGYVLAVAFLIGLNHAPTSDEAYFVETIRTFGEDLSFERVKDYRAVTPPLVFLVYAGWGHIAGFELHALRILALIIAWCTFLALDVFLRRIGGASWRTAAALLVFLVNPYTIGLTVFIYTDMLMILFVLLACLAVQRGNALGLFLASTAGLLCRQYFLFVPAAALLYSGFLWLQKEHDQRRLVVAAFLSLLPLSIFFLLWGDIGPREGARHWPPLSSVRFHPDYLTVYGSVLTVYLFPVIVTQAKVLTRRWSLFCIPVLIAWYWAFPVRSSELALSVHGMSTVGLFHRFLAWLLPSRILIDIIFCSFFVFGTLVFSRLLGRQIGAMWQGKPAFSLFLDLVIVSFLILMPFSFHVWEKYALPLLPVLLARLLWEWHSDADSSRKSASDSDAPVKIVRELNSV